MARPARVPVVLVGGDPVALSLLSHVLHLDGFDPLPTADVAAALEACRRHARPVALALVDARLPGALAALVAANPGLQGCLLGADPGPGDPPQGGAVAVLLKPLDFGLVVSTLRGLLDTGRC
jgi:CheY-like chemotaxis protein